MPLFIFLIIEFYASKMGLIIYEKWILTNLNVEYVDIILVSI